MFQDFYDFYISRIFQASTIENSLKTLEKSIVFGPARLKTKTKHALHMFDARQCQDFWKSCNSKTLRYENNMFKDVSNVLVLCFSISS